MPGTMLMLCLLAGWSGHGGPIHTALGTAGRPEAVLDLHSNFIDLGHGLVTLNPPGWKQTRKYRPTVKLPDTLRSFVIEGYQVSYCGKPCNGIETAWRNHRRRCSFDVQINPCLLRDTKARTFAPLVWRPREVAAPLGYRSKYLSTTEIYAPFDPSCPSEPVAAIDLFAVPLDFTARATADFEFHSSSKGK